MEKIRFTYNQITQMCEDLADDIRSWEPELKPTSIVGIIRGGCVPAVILSHLLGIPCKMLAYSSHNGFGDNQDADNHIPYDIVNTPGQLLVDDICDSGNTLKEIMEEICSAGNTAATCTMVFRDHDKSNYEPCSYGVRITTENWIVFPWEQ